MKREILLPRLKSNQMGAKALLADITEEESLVRGKDNMQPIRWQTGHLLNIARINNVLLGGKPKVTEERVKPFGRGVKMAKDISSYPPMEELRQELFDLYDETLKLAENVTDEELDRPTPEFVGFDQSIIDTLLFLNAHDFYHFGQIVTVRRCCLGREQSFG